MKARGPRSEATKAILAYIREHGPVQPQPMIEHFRLHAVAACQSPASWINSRLNNMREAGYIEHGTKGWVAVDRLPQPQQGACAASKPRARDPRQAESAPQDHIAQPRRVSMFGDVYVPPAQHHRAGSEDHARQPSLINGRPTRYRSAW